MNYRPEIDGLRAVAVIAVILFHLDLPWLVGGFLGVDVFFVISGFLITSIVVRQLDLGTFRFADFWARRVRRIAPVMLLVSLTTLAIVCTLGFKALRPEVGAQALAALLSVANVYFWKQTGNYWGPQAESSPFLHTWSLAVEEQFYLCLPVALFFIHRKGRRAIMGAALLVVTLSLGAFIYGAAHKPEATFYLLPTRAWELAAGVAVACLSLRSERNPMSELLAAAGLCLIVASYFLVPKIGAGVILPVLGTVLVLATGQSGVSHRLLSLGPVVFIGRISYSLYLWHWPAIVLPQQLGLELSKPTMVALTFGLALASYFLLEQPARRAPRTVPFALAGIAVAALAAIVVARSSTAYDITAFNKISYWGYHFDLKPDNAEESRMNGARRQMDMPSREAAPDTYANGGIIIGPHSAAPSDAAFSEPDLPRVVVLGDSHGCMWSEAIRAVTERLGVTTSFYSMDGVSPLFEAPPAQDQSQRFISSEVKYGFDSARIEHIRNWQPDLVIVARRWAEQDDTVLLRTTLDFLSRNAKRVLLIGQPPELSFHGRLAVEHLVYLGVSPVERHDVFLPTAVSPQYAYGRDLDRRLAKAYDNVMLLPTKDLYERGGEALVMRDGNVVYLDEDHLTSYGTSLARGRLYEAIRAALAAEEQLQSFVSIGERRQIL